ncbi:hypothetical protein ACO0LC_09755 [Undibacterium sp. JH2W]|uniref:hypothetical protein n=1 Tax=Undibacterium sp. JH2W TaxID=3413037 RepID=UPI003BF048DB
MITCHVESFTEMLAELKTLLPLHYEELALDKKHVPLSPQYDIYRQHEESGKLLFVTLREAGEMIGYFIGMVSPGLHYSTCLTCIMDIFYVRKDKRMGTAGIRLFRFVEKELRRRGVQRWFMGSKIHADASALFKRIGARPVEIFYSKWLGD